jgi:ABC-2 type transport system permease protein
MRSGRLVQAYFTEAKYEFLHALRAPAFVVPFLVLPAAVYLFFGVVIAGSAKGAPPHIADYLFSGFAVMAILGPALFGGISVAMERDGGLMRLKRALPAPSGSYLMAKVATCTVYAALAAISVLLAALIAGKIDLSAMQLLIMSVVYVLGAIPFCAISLFIATHASGNAAPAFVYLTYFPMMYLSGLFIPLPKTLEHWTVIWPTFHVDQLALAAAGLKQFRFVDPMISVAVLVATTVLFGGLALRRLQRFG